MSQSDNECVMFDQDEDSPFPETSHSQSQSKEVFKEEHEETGDLNLNQLEKKFAPACKEAGARYTIAEDLQILNYTNIHPLPSIGSRKYWQQAIKDSSFPCKYRPVESLRDRYRYQLRFVEEADKKRMEEWVEKYGNKGYSLFSTVPLKGVTGGKKGIRRKLVLFGLEDTMGCHISVNEIEKANSIQSDTSMNKNKSKMSNTSGSSKHIGVDCDTQISTSDPSLFQLQVTGARKSKSKLQHSLKDIDKSIEANVSSKKRKEYHHMSETDSFFMPYKEIKSNLNSNLLGIEHESALIKDVNSKTYETVGQECLRKSRLMDLFYSCSMNCDRVSEYLKSNRSVSWSEQEDRLLMGPEKETHINTLSFLKGAANVRERIEFLEKFNELFGNPENKIH